MTTSTRALQQAEMTLAERITTLQFLSAAANTNLSTEQAAAFADAQSFSDDQLRALNLAEYIAAFADAQSFSDDQLRALNQHRCFKCGFEFQSRTKLFDHLRSEKHGVLGLQTATKANRLAQDLLFACSAAAQRSKALDLVSAALASGVPANGRLESGESTLWLATANSILWPSDEALETIRLLRAAGANEAEKATATCRARNATSQETMWALPPLKPHSALALATEHEAYATCLALTGLPSNYVGETCPIHLCSSVLCAASADTLELEAAACGHAACLVGWQRWIDVQCSEQARVVGDLLCLQCDTPMSYEDVKRLTRRDPELMAQVERRTVEAALQNMEDFSWCPRVGCGSGGLLDQDSTCSASFESKVKLTLSAFGSEIKASVLAQASAASASCLVRECVDCEFKFCRECKRSVSEHTLPSGSWLPCNRVEEALLTEWRAANRHKVKACPKCRVLTEHISGCSHMRCRCGFEWCWLCLRRYQGRYVGLTGEPDQKCTCPPIKDGASSSVAAAG